MTIGIDQWVATLTIDQMRYACETMGEKIKAAEEPPKRTVWRVCRGRLCEANYREDDYEKLLTTCFEFITNGSNPKPLNGLRNHAATSTSSGASPI